MFEHSHSLRWDCMLAQAGDTDRRSLRYGQHRIPMPSEELLRDLRHLSSLANTTVVVVSGLSRQVMAQAFSSITDLWLFAETGYYMRRGKCTLGLNAV